MWKPMIEALLVPWRVFLGLTRNSCCARSEKTLSTLGRSQVWSYRMMRLMWTRILGRLRTGELSSWWNEASAPRTPRGVWVHWNCPWSGRVNAVVVVACSWLSHLPRQSGKVQGGEKFWLFFFDVGQRLIDILEFDGSWVRVWHVPQNGMLRTGLIYYCCKLVNMPSGDPAKFVTTSRVQLQGYLSWIGQRPLHFRASLIVIFSPFECQLNVTLNEGSSK